MLPPSAIRCVLATVGAVAALIALQGSVPATLGPRDFMSSMCGTWLGTGLADGLTITEHVEITWNKDRTALLAVSKPVSGDEFRSETEIRYLAAENLFQSVERNNGRWPMRVFRGKLVGNSLVLTEKTEERQVQLSLKIEQEHVIQIEEPLVEDGRVIAPFVQLTYRRRAGGECAA